MNTNYIKLFGFSKSQIEYHLTRGDYNAHHMIFLPPVLNSETKEKSKINFLMKLFIKKFIRKNKAINPNFNLNFLYNNLSTLTINAFLASGTIEARKHKILANYVSDENIINVFSPFPFDALTHELFHAATTYRGNPDIIYIGFKQNDYLLDRSIGHGFNEGYTSLIDVRTFKKDYMAYPVPHLVMQQIERIIGQEKLDEYYSNLDLKGLVNEMSKYTLGETCKRLIVNLDDMLYAHDNVIQKKVKEKQKVGNKNLANEYSLAIMGDLAELKIFELKEKYKKGITIDHLEIELKKYLKGVISVYKQSIDFTDYPDFNKEKQQEFILLALNQLKDYIDEVEAGLDPYDWREATMEISKATKEYIRNVRLQNRESNSVVRAVELIAREIIGHEKYYDYVYKNDGIYDILLEMAKNDVKDEFVELTENLDLMLKKELAFRQAQDDNNWSREVDVNEYHELTFNNLVDIKVKYLKKLVNSNSISLEDGRDNLREFVGMIFDLYNDHVDYSKITDLNMFEYKNQHISLALDYYDTLMLEQNPHLL